MTLASAGWGVWWIVLFLHRFDPGVPLEEQIRAMNELIEGEKAYYWGVSEFTPQQLMECFQICDRLGLIPPTAEQPQYNMLYRDVFERDLAPFLMITASALPFGLH